MICMWWSGFHLLARGAGGREGGGREGGGGGGGRAEVTEEVEEEEMTADRFALHTVCQCLQRAGFN